MDVYIIRVVQDFLHPQYGLYEPILPDPHISAQDKEGIGLLLPQLLREFSISPGSAGLVPPLQCQLPVVRLSWLCLFELWLYSSL